jgi:curli biogenesis system outer membrane secretion channel CsgG
MKHRLVLYGLLVCLALPAISAFAEDAPALTGAKKRIAVFSFQDKTEQHWSWWHGKGVGDGMADMLATALVKSGHYRVMERDKIASLLAEQNLGAAGVTTQESAAKAGKMLGVELAVIGAVTEFGYKQRSTGGLLKKAGIGAAIGQYTSVIGVDVRIVNTTTGEILKAENVRRQKTATSLGMNTNSMAFGSEAEFDQSLVGKVTREAIEDIVKILDAQAGGGAWEAKVVMAKEGEVVINSGQESGVKVGDTFVIYRPGEDMKDPDTGESLGAEETRVGTIEVVNNNFGGKGKASTCKITSGSGFKTGDLVRQK